MLLFVATNPSVDRTLHVPLLTLGQVHRTSRVAVGAGGKGLNAARAARALGQPARVTGLLAGHTGAHVADLAAAEGLDTAWHHRARGETRVCLLLNHDQGDATVINEAGEDLAPQEWRDFGARVEGLAAEAQAVALAGSVPPSVTPEAYVDLCRTLARRTGCVYVDTNEEHLAAVVRDPRGLAVKVNRREIEGALGRRLDEPSRLVAELRALLGMGACLAVVTMGGEGALAADPSGVWRVTGPSVRLVSSVGSGDSFLAGLATGALQGLPMPEALRLAAACGAANAETPLPASFTAARVAELRRAAQVERVG